MKKFTLLLFLCALLLTSCGDGGALDREIQRGDSLQTQLDAALSENYILHQRVTNLRDSLEVLRYPSADRLAAAIRKIQDNDLTGATNELDNLIAVFPQSQEATRVPELREQIAWKQEAARREAERIASLGFKAITPKTTIEVGYNKVALSGITSGREFSFDYYDGGDRWHYLTADRGNKYVTMSMSVTSTSHNPKLPAFAVYRINGAEMSLVRGFVTRYARWDDYGSYLGNYQDIGNDFSKRSTVRFRLGAEISESVANGPYAIVMYNHNVLTEHYDRWDNPPKSWSGTAPFSQSLTVDSFQSGNYVLVKTVNFR